MGEGKLSNGTSVIRLKAWNKFQHQGSGVTEMLQNVDACSPLTVSYDAQYGQIDQTLPVGSFLQGDAVTCCGEDVTAADGYQLAAVVSARHVVQHRGVVNECIQLPVREPQVLDLLPRP